MVSAQDCNNIDHYAVLGLPSGEQGAKLSPKEIHKAYLNQAREVHPDKRKNDPNANSNFQKLTLSYKVLKDPDARRAFDALTMGRALRGSHQSAESRQAAADLVERERAAAAAALKDRREKQAKADLKRDMEDFKARNAKKAVAVSHGFIGHRPNPLHVLPAHATPDSSKLCNILDDLDDYETSTFKRLKKAMEIRNQSHGI